MIEDESSLTEIEENLPRAEFSLETWETIRDCIHKAYCVGYVDGFNRGPIDPYKVKKNAT